MSTLGTSVINKSNKKLAPKAPARRQAAPVSSQTSTKASTDRQAQSQQLLSQLLTQQNVLPTAIGASLPTSPSTQRPLTAGRIVATQDGTIPLVSIPRDDTPASRSVSRSTDVPQTRPFELDQLPRQTSPVIVCAEIDPDGDIADQNPCRSQAHSPTPHGTASAWKVFATIEPGRIVGPHPRASPDGAKAPLHKRRKVSSMLEESQPSIESLETGASPALPTTEIGQSIADESSHVQAVDTSQRFSKVNGSKSSARSKRSRPIEPTTREGIVETTSSASVRNQLRKNNAKKNVDFLAPAPSSEISTNDDQESSGQADESKPVKSKRNGTRWKSRQAILDAATGIIEDAVRGSFKDPRQRGRRSKRAVTPEGADKITISPSRVKMLDLCQDGHIGRKSERERSLAEIERAEFMRKKQTQLQEVTAQIEREDQTVPSETSETRLQRLERQKRDQDESVVLHVPNTIIVNGQIQIDEDSLQIDRHAAAAIERDSEQLEAVDESDLTRKVNSGTWVDHTDKNGAWNEILTERFYDGLRMFGTDFEMISRMFPGRTRHKIKLKFTKEEKHNHDRIRATLLGEKLAVDLSEYEKMVGTEFDDPRELEKDMEEDRKRLEEEILAEKKAMEDALSERAEQIAREGAAAGDESSKENRIRKGRKKGEKREKREPGKEENRLSKRAAVIAAADQMTRDAVGDI